MADEIRMYASSDFDDNAAPTEISPAQEIELEDEEEESIQTDVVEIIEAFVIDEPVAVVVSVPPPAKKAAKKAPAKKSAAKKAPA